jgi:hypothetical protein
VSEIGTGSALSVPEGDKHTLLRAKPSKGGDAELRDYREVTRHVRRAASDPETDRKDLVDRI